jgi:hypothetical protein
MTKKLTGSCGMVTIRERTCFMLRKNEALLIAVQTCTIVMLLNYSNATTTWSKVWMGAVPCRLRATHRTTPKMKTARKLQKLQKMIKRMNKELESRN